MRVSSLRNPRATAPCAAAHAHKPTTTLLLRRLIVAARAAAADDADASAGAANANPDAANAARAPPSPPPPPPSAYTSVAPLSPEARARDAAAARELAARTRAELAARLLDAAGQVAEADAAERRRERQQQRRRRWQQPAPLPAPPPPLSPEEAVHAAIPVVLERADPVVVAWQRRRRRRGGAGEEEEDEETTTANPPPPRRQREAELRRLLAPHLPAAVRLATAAALERSVAYCDEDEEDEEHEQEQQLLLPSPPRPRPQPPPPAPADPDALLAAVRAAPSPTRRIVVFKGGGYRYDDLEASINQAGVGHVFRLTNLALKARCVLSTERWLSSGRRASLAQHRALAAARRIPLFVVPPGEPVDARALCWAARALLVAKGVLAPGEGETRAELEGAVAAAVPPAPINRGGGGQRPVGFRGPVGPMKG